MTFLHTGCSQVARQMDLLGAQFVGKDSVPGDLKSCTKIYFVIALAVFLVEEDHHLRSDVVNFGDYEPRVAPTSVTGHVALANGMDRIRWLRQGGGPRHSDPVRRLGMKRVSSLFRLPYWQVRLLPGGHS